MDFKQIFERVQKRDDSFLNAIYTVLYEFKKLPCELVGRKAKIKGTIGGMEVDLLLEFEPERLDRFLGMMRFLEEYYRKQKEAIKKIK